MSDGTKIEWADATANYVNGCSVVSPGCTNCYAMRLAGTRMRHHPTRAGLTTSTKAGPVWNGTIRLNEAVLDQVLRWKRPRRIFWNAHGDLFHEAVPDEAIDRQFAVMALTPQHQHIVLTKRSARMRGYVTAKEWRGHCYTNLIETALGDASDEFSNQQRARMADAFEPLHKAGGPLPNVWLGVSVEDQARADERIPDLLATPAAVRWISAEPLLGPLDLTRLRSPGCTWLDALTGDMHAGPSVFQEFERGLDWAVAGGESGPGARPMHPDWARSLRDQCAAAGVPFFFKQWGEWAEVGHEEDGPKVTEVRTQRGRDMHSARAQGPIGFISAEGRFFATEDAIRGRARLMHRIGKKRSGDLLDGVQHHAWPV